MLLYAGARGIAGRDALEVELPEPARVADLKRALRAARPELGPLLDCARIAVDHEYADDACILNPESEIALIPPVSGGAPASDADPDPARSRK